MEKQKINLNDYANHILRALPEGFLLTTKAGEKINTMAIGWGALGLNWRRPVFIAFVREGRFTRQLLDENPEFTVNIPLHEADKEVIRICGGKSGRDTDKLKEAGLTPVEAETVSVPALREFPLTLECRVIYRQKQELQDLGEDIRQTLYPQDVPGTAPGLTRDAHITYYGEILSAYILTD